MALVLVVRKLPADGAGSAAADQLLQAASQPVPVEGAPLKLAAQPGLRYELLHREAGTQAVGQQLARKGRSLQVYHDKRLVLELDEFFEEPPSGQVPAQYSADECDGAVRLILGGQTGLVQSALSEAVPDFSAATSSSAAPACLAPMGGVAPAAAPVGATGISGSSGLFAASAAGVIVLVAGACRSATPAAPDPVSNGNSPTPALSLVVDSGISASDGTTNLATVNVLGLDPGARWQYRVDAGGWIDGVGSSFDLSDGGSSYQVRQLDASGRPLAHSVSVNFRLDTQAPKLSTAAVGARGASMGETVTLLLEFDSPVYGLSSGTDSSILKVNGVPC